MYSKNKIKMLLTYKMNKIKKKVLKILNFFWVKLFKFDDEVLQMGLGIVQVDEWVPPS